MADEKEMIYDSAPAEPDDEFWLEQGKKMVGESITAVREAARTLMTGLGLLQGIYLGILGLADYIPATMPLEHKGLFLLPLLLWLTALYHCLQVMMTRRLDINLLSPDDIRKKSEKVLTEKQRKLQWAFWMLVTGLIAALILLVFRL